MKRNYFEEFRAEQKLRMEFEEDWCAQKKVVRALVRAWFRQDLGHYVYPTVQSAWEGYRIARLRS